MKKKRFFVAMKTVETESEKSRNDKQAKKSKKERSQKQVMNNEKKNVFSLL